MGIYSQCSTDGETGLLICINKMWKTPLKSGILSKEEGHWTVSLLTMLLFGRCISNVLLVQISFP